jgi:mannose-6-phosphate isomerase-like protein (cupin superfamily)
MVSYIVRSKDGITGELHGGVGTFRVLIDTEICGAKNFSLLLNVTNPHVVGEEHSHEEEHGFYILEGEGIMEIDSKSFQVGPCTAIFIPAGIPHRLICSGDIPIRYIVVYAPPGPEQQLKQEGKDSFRREQ